VIRTRKKNEADRKEKGDSYKVWAA
jgi:hypothetical protein